MLWTLHTAALGDPGHFYVPLPVRNLLFANKQAPPLVLCVSPPPGVLSPVLSSHPLTTQYSAAQSLPEGVTPQSRLGLLSRCSHCSRRLCLHGTTHISVSHLFAWLYVQAVTLFTHQAESSTRTRPCLLNCINYIRCSINICHTN